MGLIENIRKKAKVWYKNEQKKNKIYQDAYEQEELRQLKLKARRDAKITYNPRRDKPKKPKKYANEPFEGLF